MQVGICKMLRGMTGQGLVVVLPRLADVLGVTDGDTCAIRFHERTVQRTVKVVEPTQKYANYRAVLLDKATRVELGVPDKGVGDISKVE